MMWSLSIDKLLKKMNVSLDGLTTPQIDSYTGARNVLTEEKKSTILMFLGQFSSIMTIILIVSGVIAFIIGEKVESYAIFGIVIMFGVLGFSQEYRAENAMKLLKNLSIPFSLVKRDGVLRQILSTELLVGDVIVLKTGDMIPADIRLIKQANLRVNEAVLTGESNEIDKGIDVLPTDTPIYKRSNMLFKGTVVVNGSAEGLVVAVGMDTELGKIAGSLSGITDDETPLQKKANKAAKVITIIGTVIGVIFCLFGWLNGESIPEMFIMLVSIIVAIIPEGLPAVIVISLAVGGKNLLKKRVLVKKLNSIETLGSVNIICTDKTGTLTEGKMKVERMSNNPNGWIYANMVLNNDIHEVDGRIVGSPTEIALYEFAKNKMKSDLYEDVIDELVVEDKKSFSSKDRYSTVQCFHRSNNKIYNFVKGAFEVVTPTCNLDEYHKRKYKLEKDRYTKLGMRVIALSVDSTFLGLVCISDGIRGSVKQSVDEAKSAGIKVVMITGDDKFTAASVGRKIGIFGHGDVVVTGDMFDSQDDSILKSNILKSSIFARILPNQKLKLIEIFKKNSCVVSMTGDGINDTPALKRADVGIAVANATDVAKDVSKMILLDNNFTNIIEAIKEGRNIYENIKRFIFFSLSGNIGKTMAILILPLICMIVVEPKLSAIVIPLMPIQLLWLNFITDGLIGLSFGFEKPEVDIMNRKPVSLNTGIFDNIPNLIMNSFMIGALSIVPTVVYWHLGSEKWQTILFTMLAFTHIFQALTLRTKDYFFKSYNVVMLYVFGFIIASQIIITQVGVLQRIFNVVQLDVVDAIICLVFSSQMLMFELNKCKEK